MSATTPIALGLRAQRGGSVAVAVAVDGLAPRVVLSTFLATAAEGDRLAFEPYHVAAEMMRGVDRARLDEARALVDEGRRRQGKHVAQQLDELLRGLAARDFAATAAVLLVNRAGWVTDLLEHSLGAPEHPPVAEGLAVRDALRAACARCGLAVLETDEKSLPAQASARLGLAPADVEGALRGASAGAGRPWRKEHKLACLAAWMLLAKPQG